jgi:DNA adenine methylase
MNEHAYRSVNPCLPPAAYIGGKKQLARRIVAAIEAIPHDTYAEPFVGMGGVFLRRRAAPKAEVINDLSGDVTNLFRILQRHYEAFLDTLRFRLTSRADFERLMATPAASLTDLERAGRFLYLQRLGFGGKVTGRTFGVPPGLPGRFDVTKLEPMLADIAERLAGVIIENLPYADFIRRYDRAGTLFYLDPPYFGIERDYGPGMFGREDFEKLAETLGGIAGRFILTVNDVPAMREVFGRFAIEEATVTYTVGKGRTTAARIARHRPRNVPSRGARGGAFAGQFSSRRGSRASWGRSTRKRKPPWKQPKRPDDLPTMGCKPRGGTFSPQQACPREESIHVPSQAIVSSRSAGCSDNRPSAAYAQGQTTPEAPSEVTPVVSDPMTTPPEIMEPCEVRPDDERSMSEHLAECGSIIEPPARNNDEIEVPAPDPDPGDVPVLSPEEAPPQSNQG